MPNLSSVLKAEIVRLARKELRAQVDPLRKAASTQRREIAELKRQVVALGRQARSTTRRAAQAETESIEPTTRVRFTAKSIQALRIRLGLSVAELGTLIGASAQSIYNWESGKAAPRQQHLGALAGLRGIGKRAARARLEADA